MSVSEGLREATGWVASRYPSIPPADRAALVAGIGLIVAERARIQATADLACAISARWPEIAQGLRDSVDAHPHSSSGEAHA